MQCGKKQIEKIYITMKNKNKNKKKQTIKQIINQTNKQNNKTKQHWLKLKKKNLSLKV